MYICTNMFLCTQIYVYMYTNICIYVQIYVFYICTQICILCMYMCTNICKYVHKYMYICRQEGDRDVTNVWTLRSSWPHDSPKHNNIKHASKLHEASVREKGIYGDLPSDDVLQLLRTLLQSRWLDFRNITAIRRGQVSSLRKMLGWWDETSSFDSPQMKGTPLSTTAFKPALRPARPYIQLVRPFTRRVKWP
jgi:hypothetical protein